MVSVVAEAGHQVMMICPATPWGELEASHDFPVVTVADYAWRPARWASRLASVEPLRAARGHRKAVRSAAAIVAAFEPDLVVVAEVTSAALASRVVGRGLPTLYDAHNVDTRLYRDLRRTARTWFERVTYGVDASRVAIKEGELARRASGILAVSEMDAEHFRRVVPQTRVDVVPNSIFTPTEMEGLSSAPKLLFVGSLDYPPNVEALTELVTEVLPVIHHAEPRVRLDVVGRRAPASLRAVIQASVAEVRLHEAVADLAPFYREARCVVLPMRSGGGTNLKVVEAMAYGVPVVCTPKAVSGFGVRDGEASVQTSSRLLADAAVQVLHDDVHATSLSKASREAFVTRLSIDTAVKVPMLAALEAALSRQ
ncbi:glycosyltransferase family 4 protein [Oryzobacter telluris]|uniref:glycosyltransferase family 4 protein n=1 Tax=Oryzobacter telluris TaxID=3149179 RepID=UPI00370D4640